MPHEAHEDLDERMLHRMLFFTDAVFAIVLTILVLELKPPEGWREANAQTLRHAVPHIGAFVFSFCIISVFWIAHMNTTRKLMRFDWPTALANLMFLLPICLLPFATSWVGADINGGFAWAIYCWTLVAISSANMVVVLVAYRGRGKLVQGGASGREVAYRMARSAAPGAAFAVGLIVLAAGQVNLAHLCWTLIGPGFWLAEAVLKPTPAPAPAPEPKPAGDPA
jgi:uncharacterized membrane protein